MSTMPLKWAVEITSPKDAERLQVLFPKYKHCIRRIIYFAGADVPNLCLSKDYESGLFGYSREKWYQEYGYTILSITELETLLNK